MITHPSPSLNNRQPTGLTVCLFSLLLAGTPTVAMTQDAPAGYLARGLGGFTLRQAPPPKRPTKPLPPLPVVYNPQPGRSGHAAQPITQTAAQPEFSASSETQFMIPGAGGALGAQALVAPIVPQQSMLNPQTLIHMFKGADGNTTIIPLNAGPSLYQLPAFPIRGSKAEYIRK